jgi:serine/threonine-protein kinase
MLTNFQGEKVQFMLKQFLKIAVLFVSFMVITGLCAYFTLNYIIKNEDSVVVPNLVGKSVINVLELLTNLGLNTKVKGSEYNSRFPENFVVYQHPEPGAIIKKGRDVQIIFSKGTKTTLVPRLEKENYSKAIFIIEKAGLKHGVTSFINSTNVDKDAVISSNPKSGTKIKKGTHINLLVSTGPKTIVHTMVDLRGKSLTEALLTIEKLKMKPGEINYSFNEKLLPDSITDHKPETGSRIAEGTRIDMVINRKSQSIDKEFSLGYTGVRLFKYRTSKGFLKKQLKVQVMSQGSIDEILNDYVKPDEDIWIFLPLYTAATLFLYEDEELINTKIFD